MLSLVALDAEPDAPLEPPDRVVAVAALEARELRLLALAVGDHLPVELTMAVAALRAQRAALQAG